MGWLSSSYFLLHFSIYFIFFLVVIIKFLLRLSHVRIFLFHVQVPPHLSYLGHDLCIGHVDVRSHNLGPRFFHEERVGIWRLLRSIGVLYLLLPRSSSSSSSIGYS